MRSFTPSFAFLLILGASPGAAAQFEPRGSVLVRGAHEVTGNALMRCPSGTSCVNNNVELVPIDVDPLALGDLDGDGTDDTNASSAATLTLPAGARVVSASLYVAATAAELSPTYTGASWVPDEAPVRFARTGGAYATVMPDYIEGRDVGLEYQAKYDVTALVPGSGEYWVADPVMPPATHRFHRDVMWVLVVIYEDGGQMRLVHTWTGPLHCFTNSTTVELDGFRTPAAGPIAADLTIWGLDGNPAQVGDSIRLGTVLLSNALNPSNNVGNGTMSTRDGSLITRNPTGATQFEPPDLDTFDASSSFTTGQTSIDATFICGPNDGIIWFGTVISFDAFAPELTLTKTAADENGGVLVAGDVVTYELVLANAGGDDATEAIIRDAIPSGTTYVAGTLEVERDGAFVSLTDDSGDDEAEFADGTVAIRVGAGATATTGGELGVGESARVRFQVQIDALTATTTITNQAIAQARAASGGDGSAFLSTSSETTSNEASPCAVDSTAAIDPGCSTVLPACDATGMTCVSCTGDRHCDDDASCVDGACVNSAVDGGAPDASFGDASVRDSGGDAGGADASVDGGSRVETDGGCGCRAGQPSRHLGVFGLLLCLAAVVRLGRRARRR